MTGGWKEAVPPNGHIPAIHSSLGWRNPEGAERSRGACLGLIGSPDPPHQI